MTMRIFGLEITRAKANSMQAVPPSRGWFNIIRESYSGAFQHNIEIDAPRDVVAFSAVFSCVSLIASDIGKLQPRLMQRRFAGNTWEDCSTSIPQANVLRRPNHYQTRSQFFTDWIISKLLHGNAYVLKERNGGRRSGEVVGLYVLNPERVTPLVTTSGEVYYRVSADHLSQLQHEGTFPASEIIHDRGPTLWHPLVGNSPIYACGMSATVGNRIQQNSGRFFANASRPSGMLSAPQTIDDETALRLKNEFENCFAGSGMGRLFVAGDGLKYEAMTIPAADAQLIEQLKWTVEDVARCFHVPLFKIGGPVPATNTVEALNQQYYADCLQSLIEAMEQCLDAGLALEPDQRTEFDLDGLLRMDASALYEALGKAVGGGWMAPNEARERVNLPPVSGGATPYLQVQNYSLAALDRRDRAQGAPSTSGAADSGAAKTIAEALLLRDAQQRGGGRGYLTRDVGSGANDGNS
jgi:HK97 family phage portal protein